MKSEKIKKLEKIGNKAIQMRDLLIFEVWESKYKKPEKRMKYYQLSFREIISNIQDLIELEENQ